MTEPLLHHAQARVRRARDPIRQGGRSLLHLVHDFDGAVEIVRLRKPDGSYTLRLVTRSGPLDYSQARSVGYVDDGRLGWVHPTAPRGARRRRSSAAGIESIGDRLYTINSSERPGAIGDRCVRETGSFPRARVDRPSRRLG